MKKYAITLCLALTIPTCSQASPIPEQPLSLNNTLAFAAVYGALSGCLCRTFEHHILGDFLPFRLCNLLLWGSIERSIMQDYIKDLEQQQVIHSSAALLNLARVVSWLGYFGCSAL